ncbi:MAG TPA: chorismate synthase [Eubacterium sp.]|nr:chorismate synthase [Eubacterium sp.]
MAGSVYGKLFRISTWGESHGKGVGVVVDGCPAGLALGEADVQRYLNRRKPGQSRFTTARGESDSVEILSGVFEGKTTGTPISMIVYNKDQHSRDYDDIKDIYRPGHADITFDSKYGFRDYRGGGRSSGRETIARVAGGAVACKILEELGISVEAYTKSIGDISIDDSAIDMSVCSTNAFYMPDAEAALKAEALADACRQEMDSMGGVVECRVKGLMRGIGETVFDKLDANLAKAIMSIGAVKGFEIGEGFNSSLLRGSTDNDEFYMTSDSEIEKKTNHSGGVLGGMSDGSEVVLRAAFKPTPSIARAQNTVNRMGEDVSIEIKGRHDPLVVPRAVVVVETMTALTVLDLVLENMTSRLDKIKEFYYNK